MKPFIIVLIALSAVFAACGGEQKQEASQAAQAEVYTCPMHPSVISDRPGACPVCGMALVRKAAQKDMSEKDASMLETVSLSSAQRIMANVAVTTVEKRRFDPVIEGVGVIDVAEPRQAVVAARFNGRIEKLYADFTGALVKKGAPLFELYSPDLFTAQQEFLLTLDAPAGTNRQVGTAGNATLESARSRLSMHYGLTEDQIAVLEKSRKVQPVTVYNSPITGTVLAKNVKEGEYVNAGAAVYSIADLSRVWVYLEIYEKDIRYTKTGQTVKLSLDAYPGEQFTGLVVFIDPVMNSSTRTIRVRTEFANTRGKLRPGMYAKGAIALGKREAVAVPEEAVVRTGKRDVVWVQTGKNAYEPRQIRLGQRAGGWYEVMDGVAEGDLIVATGGYLIDSESQLMNPDAASPHAGHQAQPDGKDGAAPSRSSESVESHEGHETGKNDRTETSDNDPHAGHDMDSQDSKQGKQSVQTVKLTIEDGEYKPDVLNLTKGKKVRLEITRKEKAKCTEEIVFPDFDIRKTLPAFKTTVIEFTPRKAGEFRFHCGMDMVEGKLIVKEAKR